MSGIFTPKSIRGRSHGEPEEATAARTTTRPIAPPTFPLSLIFATRPGCNHHPRLSFGADALQASLQPPPSHSKASVASIAPQVKATLPTTTTITARSRNSYIGALLRPLLHDAHLGPQNRRSRTGTPACAVAAETPLAVNVAVTRETTFWMPCRKKPLPGQ